MPIYLNFLLTLVTACPVTICGSNDIGVCGYSNTSHIILNDKGCIKDEYCNVDSINDWRDENGTYLHCKQFEDNDTTSDDVPCGQRDIHELLLEDIHPKRCNSSSDCMMMNGKETDCLCGMDGYFYCLPEWGSEVFDLFWDYCKDNDNKVTYDLWVYFKDLHDYYNYYVTAPDCAMLIFYELQNLDSLPDSAYGLVILGVLYMGI